MSFCTDLPIIKIAIWSTLRRPRFEGCLEVEGWLKTGNKGHSFRAWLSLELLPTFSVVLLIRDMAECYLIKVVTMRKLLISAAKMTKLWLGIAQHLVRWPPLFISLLQSACLREHLYKIWEKSIWYFYHASATLTTCSSTQGKLFVAGRSKLIKASLRSNWKVRTFQRKTYTVKSHIFVRYLISYFRTFEKSAKFNTGWKFILSWGHRISM